MEKNITLINSISVILTNISPICFQYYRIYFLIDVKLGTPLIVNNSLNLFSEIKVPVKDTIVRKGI